MMKKTKPKNGIFRYLALCYVCCLLAVPVSAQTGSGDEPMVLFRFVSDRDMFYREGNEAALDSLFRLLDPASLTTGSVKVDGYSRTKALSRTRCNRVKSELITHRGLREAHFTTQSLTGMFRGRQNIVVVTVPLTLPEENVPVTEEKRPGYDAKVAELAPVNDRVTEAAAKVEAYNRKVSGEAEAEKARQAEAQRIAAEKAEAERIAKEKEQAEQKRLAEEKAAKERAGQAEQERLAAGQAVKNQGKEEQNKTTAHHFQQGWYAGVQGGLPFGISGMSSFGADKTRAGWSAGIYGGYRFNPILSLEAQAAWGEMNLSVRNCCPGYWLGSDGNRYEAAVAGMEGWNYGDLKSRVATQRYGMQLNVNILGFFNSTKTGRWTLELSPQLSAIGTKAAFRTIADNAVAMKGATRRHFGAGGNLQAGYGITGHLHIVLYTGLTYLTGKPMDGLPACRHKNNFVWESGLRLGWRFGNNGKEVRK